MILYRTSSWGFDIDEKEIIKTTAKRIFYKHKHGRCKVINFETFAKSLGEVHGMYKNALPGPFIQDGWQCVTDGIILIRKPMSGENTPGKFPQVAAMFFGITWDNLSDLPPWVIEKTTAECDPCDGTGKLTKCQECGGEGVTTCDECGSEGECDECDGAGEVADGDTDCNGCHGTGSVDQYPDVKLFGQWFDGKYLAMVYGLESVQGNLQRDMLIFRSGKIQGLLMPLTGVREGKVKVEP